MMVLLVWLHVLAAVSWIGGTIFLSVVLMPVLKREPFASQRSLLFRTVEPFGQKLLAEFFSNLLGCPLDRNKAGRVV